MNSWLWKHLVGAEYGVSAAIDRCLDDFDDLSDDDQRKVIRAGLRTLLAEMAKRQKLTIPNGTTTQLPLFASVLEGGRWVRVSYLTADLTQLRQLVVREEARGRQTSERLARMQKDLDLYERHPDQPSLEAVWRLESIEYRVEEAVA